MVRLWTRSKEFRKWSRGLKLLQERSQHVPEDSIYGGRSRADGTPMRGFEEVKQQCNRILFGEEDVCSKGFHNRGRWESTVRDEQPSVSPRRPVAVMHRRELSF